MTSEGERSQDARKDSGRWQAMEGLLRTDFGEDVDARAMAADVRARLRSRKPDPIGEAERANIPLTSAKRSWAWIPIAASVLITASITGFKLGSETAMTRTSAQRLSSIVGDLPAIDR